MRIDTITGIIHTLLRRYGISGILRKPFYMWEAATLPGPLSHPNGCQLFEAYQDGTYCINSSNCGSNFGRACKCPRKGPLTAFFGMVYSSVTPHGAGSAVIPSAGSGQALAAYGAGWKPALYRKHPRRNPIHQREKCSSRLGEVFRCFHNQLLVGSA